MNAVTEKKKKKEYSRNQHFETQKMLESHLFQL